MFSNNMKDLKWRMFAASYTFSKLPKGAFGSAASFSPFLVQLHTCFARPCHAHRQDSTRIQSSQVTEGLTFMSLHLI